MVKVALIGYGQMGKSLEALAPKEGIEIVAIIDPKLSTNKITKDSLQQAEVCIDFTHPKNVLKNIKELVALKKSILVGTTGWYDHLEEVKKLVREANVGFLYAENFSIGIELFEQIVCHAAKLFLDWPLYEMSLHEEHHRHKKDSPSGTALRLQELLRKVTQKELPLSSHRMGYIPGIHRFQIDSPYDTITLTHSARSREGFAQGALKAAKWMQGNKGFFHLKEILCKV